jgi:enoyl-CoA hydratase
MKGLVVTVDLGIDEGIATITMNRPQALNAFNSAQLDLLLSVVRDVAANPNVRVAILTGSGERAFAAGADIKEMVALGATEGLAFGRRGHAVANALEAMPQPVIAAVNGFAFGGGCELALACDIRIASENARFAQPEVGLGIPPGWGGSQRLPRLVGLGIASELILTGRHVFADEALRIGLVNAVHPLAQLMPAAQEMARSIAKNSPRAVRSAKSLMKLAFQGAPGAGLDADAHTFGAAFETADQREGMSAFVEKRTAIFQD